MIQNIFEKLIKHSFLTKETQITIAKCFSSMKDVGTTIPPKEVITTVKGCFLIKVFKMWIFESL